MFTIPYVVESKDGRGYSIFSMSAREAPDAPVKIMHLGPAGNARKLHNTIKSPLGQNAGNRTLLVPAGF